MFDTIIYIPTILAYTFISLLIVILCFIIIYVSHKVYLNIYDILPVPAGEETKSVYKANSTPGLSYFIFNPQRKTPPLRIYICVRRSRLAVLVLRPKISPDTMLLKYTDSISTIPWNSTTPDEHSLKEPSWDTQANA